MQRHLIYSVMMSNNAGKNVLLDNLLLVPFVLSVRNSCCIFGWNLLNSRHLLLDVFSCHSHLHCGGSYHCTLLWVIKKSELPCSYHGSFRFLITHRVPCRDLPIFNSPFCGIPVLKRCTLLLFVGLFPCLLRDSHSHLTCQTSPKACVQLSWCQCPPQLLFSKKHSPE